VTKRNVSAGVPAFLLALLLLVGCSTGSAPEASRGQQQDATRDSVISDMQATRTWEIIHGTPASTPDAEP
jgi:PBP1b-binding outer membrane lipoprotein LpoB